MLDGESVRAGTQLAVEAQRVGAGEQGNDVLILRYPPGNKAKKVASHFFNWAQENTQIICVSFFFFLSTNQMVHKLYQ